MQRVLKLAERLCRLEGADPDIVYAAALFHDAQFGPPGEATTPDLERRSHHARSADLAKSVLERLDWPPQRIAAVQHCILAHRFRDESAPPETTEARVLFDADKLDAIGAVGVARAIAYAIRQGQPFYSAPSPEFLASGCLQPAEPHSAYHEYLYKLRHIKSLRLYAATFLIIESENIAAGTAP